MDNQNPDTYNMLRSINNELVKLNNSIYYFLYILVAALTFIAWQFFSS
jgi:hypothetical protein